MTDLSPCPQAVANWMIARSYATGHGDTIEDMLGELEWQARERGSRDIWQPIESAPRDGTAILATGGGLDSDIEIASYNPRVGCWSTTNYTLDDLVDEPQGYSRPSHWMPLPTPPLSGEEGNSSSVAESGGTASPKSDSDKGPGKAS